MHTRLLESQPPTQLPVLSTPLLATCTACHTTTTTKTNTQPQPDDKSGSTWEQILRAQDFKRRSFSDIDRDKDGYVDAKVGEQGLLS